MLRQAGIEHDAIDPGLDDGLLHIGCSTPVQWVAGLAYLKAMAGFDRLIESGHDVRALTVLGADTAVVVDDQLFGKPIDASDARRMIIAMSGRWHRVVTGVAIIEPARGARRIFADAAQVWVGEIGPREIEAYIATGNWRGKAGAYNLQEQIDAGWEIRVEGDPGTVMGLPMIRLGPMIERMRASHG
jgi:septum formation protein